jgi:hypothetical protein
MAALASAAAERLRIASVDLSSENAGASDWTPVAGAPNENLNTRRFACAVFQSVGVLLSEYC